MQDVLTILRIGIRMSRMDYGTHFGRCLVVQRRDDSSSIVGGQTSDSQLGQGYQEQSNKEKAQE